MKKDTKPLETFDIPCKVNDIVYYIHNKEILECEVCSWHFTKNKKYVKIRPLIQPQCEYSDNKVVFFTPSINSYKKTWFSTYEEARKKKMSKVYDFDFLF